MEVKIASGVGGNYVFEEWIDGMWRRTNLKSFTSFTVTKLPDWGLPEIGKFITVGMKGCIEDNVQDGTFLTFRSNGRSIYAQKLIGLKLEVHDLRF